MKKSELNPKLKLSKKVISNLNQITGGNAAAYTDGCTDGCSAFATAWNCTEADCTRDCDF